MVSVFMVTYNHEKFVAQAIESVVTQRVNFDFKLVIGEDCSPDGTRAICEQYAMQYPDRITLLPSDRNHGPQGNTIRVLYACTGKYIAFCEGDDYWIDADKLQKQVDFLEANQDFSICFSDVVVVDEMGDCREDKYPRKGTDIYTIEDIILSPRNIIPTPSLICRNVLPNPLPVFFVKAMLSGDIIIQLLTSDKGLIKYVPEKTAAYRNHQGGITKIEKYKLASDEDLFQIFVAANSYFNKKYDKVFRQRLLDMTRVNLINGSKYYTGMARLKHIYKQFGRYFHYSDRVNFREVVYYLTILFFPGLLKKVKK
jgi:glycosyltransferase involved in cell wall biosynthesis